MLFKRTFLLIMMIICLFISSFALAEDGDVYGLAKPAAVSFPAGSLFKGILLHRISSELNNVGDSVQVIIPFDVMMGRVIAIPKDSKFIGNIVRLERAKSGENGFFQIVFNNLILPDGEKITTLAHVSTPSADGIIGGGFTEKIGFKKVPHSMERLGEIAQLLPDGPRVMGKGKEEMPGNEWIIVLDKSLIIKVSD